MFHAFPDNTGGGLARDVKKSQQRELIELIDEASTAMSSGNYEEARNLFEYVRAALGDNGATVVRHGANQYSLAEVLNFILSRSIGSPTVQKADREEAQMIVPVSQRSRVFAS